MKTKNQRRSQLQEKRIAEDIGGRAQPGSGNTWHSKADARAILDLRVEAKFTDKDYYILKREDLFALEDAAIKGGLEEWVMQVEFPLFKRTFAICSYKWFLMTQPMTGRQLFQAVIDVDTKSMRIPVRELMCMAGNAAVNQGDWSYCLIFQPPKENTASYALLDWDDFLRLRELSKACVQSATSSEVSKTSPI